MLDAETGHELWMIGLEAGPGAAVGVLPPTARPSSPAGGGVLSFIDAQTGRLR